MDAWICQRDPEIMSGELCFTGTRVPVYLLFGSLEAGETVETFLDDYPSVTADQAKGVLNASWSLLEAEQKQSASHAENPTR